jgi:hypothetical protein
LTPSRYSPLRRRVSNVSPFAIPFARGASFLEFAATLAELHPAVAAAAAAAVVPFKKLRRFCFMIFAP